MAPSPTPSCEAGLSVLSLSFLLAVSGVGNLGKKPTFHSQCAQGLRHSQMGSTRPTSYFPDGLPAKDTENRSSCGNFQEGFLTSQMAQLSSATISTSLLKYPTHQPVWVYKCLCECTYTRIHTITHTHLSITSLNFS